jgi:Tir chaperone protein (CesT) family
MSRFDELLVELSEAMDIDLHADENGTCLIEFEGDLELQLEPDDEGENFLYGMVVGHLSAGKARELLFKAALIANNNHLPGTGIFAFSRHADELVIQDSLPLEGISAEVIAASIELLLEKGREWQDAIRRGVTPDPQGLPPGAK